MLLYNLRVFGEPDVEYILIRGNRIEKIGKGAHPTAARKINMHGALILPGFCDAHTHLSNVALMHSQLELTGLSREEVLKAVGRECKRRNVVIGRGWDESFWKRKEYITAEELDNVCAKKPVFLIREDGHLAVLNTSAQREFGVVGEDGIVREKDVENIMKLLRIGESLDFEYAQDYALSKGITCVHDFASGSTLRKYMEMHRRGELKIRIYASFYSSAYPYVRRLGLHSGFGDDFLKIGALKLFADGSIGAKTAATDYLDGTRMEPMLEGKKLKRTVEKANRNGIRVFTHAIGNYAISEVLNAYKGTKGNRIEHFELVEEEHLGILESSVCMQPNFLKWAKKGGLYEKMLGSQWLSRNNPYRLIIDGGGKLLFGSDCMPMNPLFGIHLAVNTECPLQRISIEEAVYAYTKGSKYFGKKFGRLKEGYVADLVAIEGELKDSNIANAQVLMTIVDGKIMYTSQ